MRRPIPQSFQHGQVPLLAPWLFHNLPGIADDHSVCAQDDSGLALDLIVDLALVHLQALLYGRLEHVLEGLVAGLVQVLGKA